MENIKSKITLGPKAQIRIIAIAVSLLLCALILALFGADQRLNALQQFFIKPVTTVYGWQEIIGSATVYLLVALGVVVMFQCQQFSLISEGSFLSGACATTFFLLQNNTKPSGFLIVTGVVIGIVAGLITAFIPAIIHAKRDVNITLVSAVTNFFILEITTYFLQRYMTDSSAGGVSYAIPLRMRLPYLYRPLGIRIGTLLAVACVVAVYLSLYRSRRGYVIRIVGANRQLATYLGLSSSAIVILSQIFAGAMAGLAGAVEMMGISTRYTWNGQFSSIGMAAILIALLSDCNPLWVTPSALLFAYLDVGGRLMQQNTGLPRELSGVVQALIVMFLFVGRYLRFAPKRSAAADRKEGAAAQKKAPLPNEADYGEKEAGV